MTSATTTKADFLRRSAVARGQGPLRPRPEPRQVDVVAELPREPWAAVLGEPREAERGGGGAEKAIQNM
eukprot:7260410-Pyramimonas_sp.AAC.1